MLYQQTVLSKLNVLQKFLAALGLVGTITACASGSAAGQIYDPDADADVTYETQTVSEGFYSVDVPEGWALDAGANDLFYTPQPVFNIISPDELSSISYGLFIPQVFVEPNDQYAEGDTVEVYGTQAQVRPYVPADTYYKEYIESNLITFDDCAAEPEVTLEPVEEELEVDKTQFPGTFDAVSIYYVCEREDGTSDIADVYYRQYRVDVEAVGSVWLVDAYVAYIAPPDQQPLVYAITDHVASSLQINQQWVQDYKLNQYGDAFAEATELSGLLAGIYGSR